MILNLEFFLLRRWGSHATNLIAFIIVTSKLQAPQQTEGTNFQYKKLGLSTSLFFSGKLQNYSEARQSLRLSTGFYQKSAAGLQLEIQHRVYNMSSKLLPVWSYT